jgi:hypothetical protein
MAEYQITYWRDVPSLVTAREGDATVKVPLPDSFQEEIDQQAMDLGLVGSDEYLEGWRRTDWTAGEGAVADLAAAVARRLEEEWQR